MSYMKDPLSDCCQITHSTAADASQRFTHRPKHTSAKTRNSSYLWSTTIKCNGNHFYLRLHSLASQWDANPEWTICSESISLSLFFCPPPHPFLSSSQPTDEQGTAGPRTMCECEGHLSQTWVYLWLWQADTIFSVVCLMRDEKCVVSFATWMCK